MTNINDLPETKAEQKCDEPKKRIVTLEAARIFGDNLHTERTSRRITQTDLKERSGVNIGGISATEQGKRNISVKTAERLANALNTELSDLLTPKDRKNQRSGYDVFLRNFKRIKSATGITAKEISDKTGIAPATISEIEAGDNCTLDVAKQLSDAIGIDFHILFKP